MVDELRLVELRRVRVELDLFSIIWSSHAGCWNLEVTQEGGMLRRHLAYAERCLV